MEDPRVEVPDAGGMHIVGHFLRAVIERNLRDGMRAPRGCIALRAGEMALTLVSDGTRVRLEPTLSPEARATVSAALETLTDVAQRRGIVPALLSGRLRLSGNPLALLPWLPLLRVPEASR